MIRRAGLPATLLAGSLLLVALLRQPTLAARLPALWAKLSLPAGLAPSSLSARLPFSLAEGLILALGLWLLLPLVWRAWQAARGRRPAGATAQQEALRIAATLSLAAAAFYLLWGVRYAQADPLAGAAWAARAPAPDAASTADLAAELAALGAELVEAVNAAHAEGAAAPPDAASLDAAIDRGLAVAGRRLGLAEDFGAPRGPAKPVLASNLLSRQGVLGFYFPWTGEANYNRFAPGYQRAHAICHEKAHQRGITGEAEANFVGYLGCALSPDAHARYAALLFAQRQILSELARHDPEQARALVARRLPGVQAEVDASRAYWARFEGPARQIHGRLNDRYLKLHGQPEGVRAYDASVRLLLRFARDQGGRVVPSTGARGA